MKMKRTINIVLLAALLTAEAAFLNAQASSQAPLPPAHGWDQIADDALKAGSQGVDKAQYALKQERYQTYAAIIALIGALASLLPKMLESVSLVSGTRRDLQRIEDLASLIQKIQAQNILSPATLEKVKIQIEAEIMLAVTGLERGRQRRIEKKTHHDDLGLSFQRQLFLLYRPVGIRAWMAHFFAYLAVIFGLFGAWGAGIGQDNDFHWRTFFAADGWLILLSLLVVASLFRMWALWERKRWGKTHPTPQPAILDLSFRRRLFLLYRPVGIRAWIAHFCAYSMVILGFLTALLSNHFFVWLFFYLAVASLFRMWALWERKRWGDAHPTPQLVVSRTG